MGREEFNNEIKRLRRFLHFFFYEKFRNAAILAQFKKNVDRLIHETTVRAWINFQRPSAAAYSIQQLINLAAQDIWVLFIKPRNKRVEEFYEPQQMDFLSGSYEMVGQLEASDYIAHLATTQDPIAWKLLELYAAGNTFEQIGRIMSIPTTTVRETIIKSQEKLRTLRSPGT
jgi:hypothetical protein